MVGPPNLILFGLPSEGIATPILKLLWWMDRRLTIQRKTRSLEIYSELCHCMKVLTQDLENLILQLRCIRRVPRGLGRLFLADNVLPVFRLLGTPPPTRFRWPGDIIGLFAYSSSIVPVMGACLGPSSLEARSSHPNKPDVRPELTLMPALGTGDLGTDTGTQRSQDAAGWASRTYCSVTGGLF